MIRCVRLVKFLKRPIFNEKAREKSTSSTGGEAICGLTRINLNARQLPKQPVPELEKTADRYLRSVRALLNDEQYRETEKLVMEFTNERGLGRKLQRSLLKRHDDTDNWMNEWFLHNAYLGNRDPLIVASSPGTVGPEQTFRSIDDFYTFAGRLVESMGTYNDSVKSGKLRQERIGEDPLDMQPYAMILGTHRQPGEKSDKLLHTDSSKHIIVMSNNHFFKLYMYDENENLLSQSQLRSAIKDVYERSRIAGKPVGILTGNNRDQWAKDHDRLRVIGKNGEILSDIEGALFVLCLDEAMPEQAFAKKNIASVRAVQSMTGYSSLTNSANRWHDKTVQYIVSPDGFVGMEYEHSPCEGVPVAVLHDHVLTSIEKSDSKEDKSTCDFKKALHLKFELDGVLERAIEDAAKLVDKLSTDIDMECLNFNDFGKAAIKEAKQSPDSFIQVAMQVAFYKSQGEPPGHYESAGLRRFRNTRTECIRSTSTETVDFAKIMCRKEETTTTSGRREAMIRAIDAHKRIAAEAVRGQGVDRHLFGLKMIAKSENLELPALYRDIGFTKSTHFNLTSSQVPYKTASFMCYGPVVDNGYGCCYNPRSDDILIACSSYKSSEETSTTRFAEALRHALRDMMRLARG